MVHVSKSYRITKVQPGTHTTQWLGSITMCVAYRVEWNFSNIEQTPRNQSPHIGRQEMSLVFPDKVSEL